MTTHREILRHDRTVLGLIRRSPITRAMIGVGMILVTGCAGPGKGKTAFVGANVFDGSGAPLILDAVIIVADGRIESLGTPDVVKVPRGATEIRLDGRWVIPGLIDAHVHAAHWTLSRFLSYGVTTIRDLGGDRDTITALRDSIALGTVVGPRMYISGPTIDGSNPTWRGATVVRNANEARRAVDDRVLLEAAHIKVYTKLVRRLLEPLMDEATAFNLPVAAHLGKIDAVTAARAGVRSLEHMSGVVEATLRNPTRLFQAHDDFFRGWNAFERAWAGLDSAALDRTARRLAETEVFIVPTLVLHEAFAHLADPQHVAELDLSGVPSGVREAWDVPDLIRRARLSASDFRAFRRSRPAQDRFIRRFRAAGGQIAAGSDSPNQLLAPGASLHRELALLVAAGLSTEDALLAATRNAARLLNADSIGVLLAGSVADFLVLTANPIEDINNTRMIERIVFRGESYDPDEFKVGW